MSNKGLIKAGWPAPANVNAFVSTKHAELENVLQHKEVQYQQQVHGTDVFHLSGGVESINPAADAIYTETTDLVCGIHTADCLPVFFTDQQGTEIALAHAGWRGLAAGVLENTVEKFKSDRKQIIVWFGPAIGPCHFEVGEEVRDLFIEKSDTSIQHSVLSAFVSGQKPGKWMADLYKLAQARLSAAGVTNISGGGLCTYCDPANFYSYRRNKDSGRITSLIWLN